MIKYVDYCQYLKNIFALAEILNDFEFHENNLSFVILSFSALNSAFVANVVTFF